jgi:hypothetical protein
VTGQTQVDATVVRVGTKPPDPGTGDRGLDVDVRELHDLRAFEDEEGCLQLVDAGAPRALVAPALPGTHLESLASSLVEILRAAARPAVAVAGDRLAEQALWRAVQVVDDVLLVHTSDTANRLLEMLGRGETPDDILFPPGFSARRSIDEAVHPGAAGSAAAGPAAAGPAADSDPAPTGHPLVLVEGPREGEPHPERWLAVRRDAVDVRVDLLTRPARRAVQIRRQRPLPAPARRSSRLTIGPANYAGQGWEWARAVRANCVDWDAGNIQIFPQRAPLSFGAELPLTGGEWQAVPARVDLAVDQILPATHVVVEALRPLLAVGSTADDVDGWSPQLGREDADALLESGRRVALLFHGSEVRRPALHAHLTPYSPFIDTAGGLTEALTRTTDRVHDAMDGFAGPRFVSTLDLLDYVPDATWLPVVVGPGSFAPAPPALRSGRPVIAHAPSSSALKGSRWVDPVLEALDDAGLITYLRVRDVPPVGMTRLLRTVDVVVDQVVLGNPGVLAAQAMAAGRLVVAHLPDAVRRRFPEPVPMVEATPDNLEQVILSILERREWFADLAVRGTEFARRYHDGRLSARVLQETFLA